MRIQDPVTKRIVELTGDNPTQDVRYRILVGRYNWQQIDDKGRIVEAQAEAEPQPKSAPKGKSSKGK